MASGTSDLPNHVSEESLSRLHSPGDSLAAKDVPNVLTEDDTGAGLETRSALSPKPTRDQSKQSSRSKRSSMSKTSEASIMGRVMTRLKSIKSEDPLFDTQDSGDSGQKPFAGAFSTAVARALSLQMLLSLVCVAMAAMSCGGMWLVFEINLVAKIKDESAEVVIARSIAAVFSFFMLALSLALSLFLSSAITVPLNRISRSAMHLGEPKSNITSDLLEGCTLPPRSSRILDISKLEHSFGNLIKCASMFTHYVPDTVVRSIFQGDEKAMRLHVSRRRVTIMFTDIKDFTAIAEQLSQEDLLLLLTRYLSVMTKIIESYGGVVAEIMGDGLLVFFNSPEDIEYHEAKACASAIAQQQVLARLNDEFVDMDLPSLELRIGLNTDTVLTGNLGSKTKMKFGCIGDGMNLASRLEGLCKVYGSNVICSANTLDALPSKEQFLFRELDLVQVKGRCAPTRIFEVLGLRDPVACESVDPTVDESSEGDTLSDVIPQPDEVCNAVLSTGFGQFGSRGINPEIIKRANLYETALTAYQQADFKGASEKLESLLTEFPDDKAAALLLERVRRCLVPGALSESDIASWTGVFVLQDK